MQSLLDGSSDAVTSHRVCRVCGEVKLIKEFRQIITDKKVYRRYQCRTCQNLMQKMLREGRALDWDYVKARREAQKRYRERNGDKLKAYQREYQRKYRARKKAGQNGTTVDD